MAKIHSIYPNLALQLFALDLEDKRFSNEKLAATGSANARNYAPEMLAGFLPEEIDDGRAEPDVAPRSFIETDDLTDASSLDFEDRLIAKIDGDEKDAEEEDELYESFADLNDEDEDGDEPDFLAVSAKTGATITLINSLKATPAAAKRPVLPEVPAKLDPKDIGYDAGPSKTGRRQVLVEANFDKSAPAKSHNGRKPQNRKGQQTIRNLGPIPVKFPTLDSLLKKPQSGPKDDEKPVMIVCRRAR